MVENYRPAVSLTRPYLVIVHHLCQPGFHALHHIALQIVGDLLPRVEHQVTNMDSLPHAGLGQVFVEVIEVLGALETIHQIQYLCARYHSYSNINTLTVMSRP